VFSLAIAMSLRKLSPAEFIANFRGQRPANKAAETVEQPPASAPPEVAFETAGTSTEEAQMEGAESEETEYVNSGRGGVVRRRRGETPDVIRGNLHLEALFERVNSLLGEAVGDHHEGFKPRVPQSLEDAGLNEEDVQRLSLKFLMQKGSGTGREIAIQIKLPFGLVDPLLRQWKHEQLLSFKGTAEMGDYIFAITDAGRDRAKRFAEECTYFGAAPVCLRDYLKSMESQSVAGLEVTEEALRRAFSDLLVRDELLDQLGPAINSGRGMFLFGEAGNGKTSLAERVTRCFGDTIWIPRALGIDGEIIRLFDPGVHEEVETPTTDGLFDLSGVDPRWVRIVRPTVVAGGELTMSELEVTQNPQTKICESPLQLKSNGGTLVIDDFGRQTMPTTVLLNRWIVPLEKRYDYLNLPSGKKIQVPFDQLIIFSTNLEPKSLVDGAFLRRIPYKIKVPDPTPAHFRKLCEILAPKLGLIHDPTAVDYLLDKHYEAVNRPLRSCQPRDLLLQVRNYCTYKQIAKRVTREGFDYAVANYFSVM
jgi:predicted ATPase with chaperone activity